MKNKFLLSLACIYALGLTGCGSSSSSSDASTDSTSTVTEESSDETTEESSTDTTEETTITYSDHESSDDANWDSDTASKITLNDSTITSDNSSVSIDETTLTITEAGTYHITGTLSDGNIIVDTDDSESVKLVLDGVDISSSTTAPIFVLNAEKTIIILADESENALSDALTYVYADSEEDEPSAAIYSKDDLSIYGDGILDIESNYNDAIKSNDGLLINANLNIVSVDDGIIGKDYLSIKGGEIDIDAQGDGLKSSNDDDSTKGYIVIEGGTINIIAEADAIQAETNLKVSDATFSLVSGGGSSNTVGEDDSAKGLKVGADIIIDGGTFTIDSADDALHATSDITINDGSLTLSTGDDGVHADETITINDGSINVTQSYEGIEAPTITMNGGALNIVASDDGLNAAGGDSEATGDYYFYMKGGQIVIDADGDGVDANGYIEMSGGTLLVNGPTANNNGALDYDNTFNITGGLLVATGSSSMAEAPSTSSTQYSLLTEFDSSLSANTMVHVEDSSGENILSFVPTKSYQALAFSSADLISGASYSIYYGGSDSGDEDNGLYTNGTYTSGTLSTTMTLSSVVTSDVTSSSRR